VKIGSKKVKNDKKYVTFELLCNFFLKSYMPQTRMVEPFVVKNVTFELFFES